MEELPIARGWQYRHAILRSHGVETYFVADQDDIENNRKLFEELLFDENDILE